MAYKVLLADDSVPAQNMGKKILIDAGYDVLTVSNGLEALRKIADIMPDIAILDIFMPGYTGLEICERLRAKAATAELPVILTVGKLEPYRPEDGAHVGSNAVIVKPFAAAELIAAVRSLVGVKRAEAVYSAEAPPPAHMAAPIQEAVAATDEKPLSAAPAEMPAGLSDEPLFSPVESVTAGNATPSALEVPGAGVAALESRHAEEEAPGRESLVFNPDAGRTPFSASAVEASTAELDVPAEAETSAFTEFHLELDAPAHDTAQSFPGVAALDSWHQEPEAAPPLATPSATDDSAAAVEQMASPEPAAMAAEPAVAIDGGLAESLAESEEAVASGEDAGALAPPVEPDSSLPEIPIPEPLVEAPEDVEVVEVAAFYAEPDEFPETILLEEDAADGEDFLTAADAPLSQEERARRQAFEDLFNSDVPFPLEEGSVPDPAPATVTPPSLTESQEHQFGEIGIEPEIAGGDFQHEPVASAPDPEAAEELEPTPAAASSFEGELMLEHESSARDPFFEIEQAAVESDSSVLGDSYTVRPDVLSDPMQSHAEVAANEPEIPAAAAPVEAAPIEAVPVEAIPVDPAPVNNEPPAPVASPERSELVAEVAKVEALLVQMQAVRQVGDHAEHAHNVTEFLQPEAAPYLRSFGSAAQLESAPVQVKEEPQIEAAAWPATVGSQIETELQEAGAAPVQYEPEVEPELVSSPLETTPEELAHARAEAAEDETSFAPAPEDGVNEAERIHNAVERVFDRFRPLLVAAIVRELVRRD